MAQASSSHSDFDFTSFAIASAGGAMDGGITAIPGGDGIKTVASGLLSVGQNGTPRSYSWEGL